MAQDPSRLRWRRTRPPISWRPARRDRLPRSAASFATPSSEPGRGPSPRARCRRCRRTWPARPSRSSGRPTRRTATSPRNLAMKLARPYRMAPLAIAAALADRARARGRPTIRRRPRSPRPRSRRPGSSTSAWPITRSRRPSPGILAAPDGWGRVAPVGRRSVNVEFVSANPTGPLHIGNARGAFVGDLLCRVLEAGGQRVTREYYFNDSGGQIRNLGASVVALRRGEPVPEDGYHGDYVHELAAAAARTTSGPRRRRPAPTRTGSSATGRPAGSARGSSAAWPTSASASTSGRARRRSTTRAGSSGRSSGSASTATSTSRTARSGSARPTSATTRTG